MRAVWSFWTKPFRAHHRHVWFSDRHHLLAWVLSVETARRHCPEISLVTDDEGARLLVDRLGLGFDHVSTELNALADADPEWWVLGKLHAYRSQTKPFVHIDSDVFLWKDLPLRLKNAPVLAQNPEFFPLPNEFWYRPITYDTALTSARGWVPTEWRWYVSSGGNMAFCCGIVGGNRVEFLVHYADVATRMIKHPRNQTVWRSLGGKMGDNILLEQYLLAACAEYYRNGCARRYKDIEVRYLFTSPDDAFDEDRAAQLGYTHLIGGAKANGALMQRLESRVRRDYPEFHERCCRVGPAAC